MSATTAVSPVEFVKGLSDEEKEEVFDVLLDTLLTLYPTDGVIQLDLPGRGVVAHLLTHERAEAMRRRYGPDCLPELDIPLNPAPYHGKSIPAEQLWAVIDATEAARAAESGSRSPG